MNAAGKRIRLAVFERADGFCECGCGLWLGDSGQLDHFWGRGAGRPEESVETCWALTARCHQAKTENKGDWLEKFQRHCLKHGLASQFEIIASRVQWNAARGAV